jgi:hypothetical protein
MTTRIFLILFSLCLIVNTVNSQCANGSGVKDGLLHFSTSCLSGSQKEVINILTKHLGPQNKKYGYKIKDQQIVIKIKYSEFNSNTYMALTIIAPYDKEILFTPLKKAFEEIKKLPLDY